MSNEIEYSNFIEKYIPIEYKEKVAAFRDYENTLRKELFDFITDAENGKEPDQEFIIKADFKHEKDPICNLLHRYASRAFCFSEAKKVIYVFCCSY